MSPMHRNLTLLSLVMAAMAAGCAADVVDEDTAEDAEAAVVDESGNPLTMGNPVMDPAKGQYSIPSKGQLPTPSKGQFSIPSKGQLPAPSKGQFSIPSKGQYSIPSKGQPTLPSKGQLSIPGQESQSQIAPSPTQVGAPTPQVGGEIAQAGTSQLPSLQQPGQVAPPTQVGPSKLPLMEQSGQVAPPTQVGPSKLPLMEQSGQVAPPTQVGPSKLPLMEQSGAVGQAAPLGTESQLGTQPITRWGGGFGGFGAPFGLGCGFSPCGATFATSALVTNITTVTPVLTGGCGFNNGCWGGGFGGAGFGGAGFYPGAWW